MTGKASEWYIGCLINGNSETLYYQIPQMIKSGNGCFELSKDGGRVAKNTQVPRPHSGKKTTTHLLPHTADTLPPNMLVMKPGGAIVFEILASMESRTMYIEGSCCPTDPPIFM